MPVKLPSSVGMLPVSAFCRRTRPLVIFVQSPISRTRKIFGKVAWQFLVEARCERASEGCVREKGANEGIPGRLDRGQLRRKKCLPRLSTHAARMDSPVGIAPVKSLRPNSPSSSKPPDDMPVRSPICVGSGPARPFDARLSAVTPPLAQVTPYHEFVHGSDSIQLFRLDQLDPPVALYSSTSAIFAAGLPSDRPEGTSRSVSGDREGCSDTCRSVGSRGEDATRRLRTWQQQRLAPSSSHSSQVAAPPRPKAVVA